MSYQFVGCSSSTQLSSNDLDTGTPYQFVAREQWGAKDVQPGGKNHTITHVTLHHGGEFFPEDKDVLNYLPTFQKWCIQDKHWIDIPYHFIIDAKGIVYEARPIEFAGDTNTSYNPAGHALICVLGNFEEQPVNRFQLQSTIMLMANLCNHYGVNADSIRSHKDYTETLCPGKNLYNYLQSGLIHSEVKKLLK